ncbi:MAG: ring-opening amidohydrolase [Burkholderiaceae bacterium]
MNSDFPRPTAAPVEILSLAMDSPEDVSLLRTKLGREFEFDDVLAIFIKSEGNGLDNDFSRLLAARTLESLFAAKRLPMLVISGGCEGFTTPHMLVVAARKLPASLGGGPSWLVATRIRTNQLNESEIGGPCHLEHCAEVIRNGISHLGLEPDEIAYIHALTPMSDQAHASKPASRAATALAAAVALDGVDTKQAIEALRTNDQTVHGSRCAVTAGLTDGFVEFLIFANVSRAKAEKLQPGSAPVLSQQQLHCNTLPDPLETTLLKQHLQNNGSSNPGHDPKLISLLYKADPPLHGRLRGERLAIDHDSDIHTFRHFRAAMSGVLAGATGSTRIFIGGGAEHHGPPGSGLLTVVTETSSYAGTPEQEPGI